MLTLLVAGAVYRFTRMPDGKWVAADAATRRIAGCFGPLTDETAVLALLVPKGHAHEVAVR